MIAGSLNPPEFSVYLVRAMSYLVFVDHLASRHVFICDCGRQCGKDSLGPLKFSQEGKSRAWHSSGEVIKGSTGNEVRTASKETFKKLGLGGDRSVCSGIWY